MQGVQPLDWGLGLRPSIFPFLGGGVTACQIVLSSHSRYEKRGEFLGKKANFLVDNSVDNFVDNSPLPVDNQRSYPQLSTG